MLVLCPLLAGGPAHGGEDTKKQGSGQPAARRHRDASAGAWLGALHRSVEVFHLFSKLLFSG